MPEHLHAHLLHRSNTVTVYDVCCRPTDRGSGPEEYSNANHIVLPRAGVFVRRIGRREIAPAPNQPLFFKRGEVSRVPHPAGGDDCTVFAFDPAVRAEAVRLHQRWIEERPDSPFEFTHTTSEPPVVLAQQRL